MRLTERLTDFNFSPPDSSLDGRTPRDSLRRRWTPLSATFLLARVQLVTEYMVQSYFKHYNLYQFAFVKGFCMTVSQSHPSDRIETAPLPLAPLSEAITEAEEEERLAREQRAREEEERQAREAKEAQAREAREALRGVECTDEVSDVIAKTVDKHVAALEEEMRKQFQQREEELLKKIEELQAAAPSS